MRFCWYEAFSKSVRRSASTIQNEVEKKRSRLVTSSNVKKHLVKSQFMRVR